MRKWIPALAFAVLLTGCTPEGTSGQPKPRSTPNAKPPVGDVGEPNPGQQPEAPFADPGPYNYDKEAVLQVIFSGISHRGSVEYSLVAGGPITREATELPKKGFQGVYAGRWRKIISVVPGGQQIGFTFFSKAQGNEDPWSQCVIYYRAAIADYQQSVRGGNCAVSYNVPPR